MEIRNKETLNINMTLYSLKYGANEDISRFKR
jgi:hypothetical protein